MLEVVYIAWSTAKESAAFLVSLTPECRQAVALSLGHCTGFAPGMSGFAPLQLAYGWLLLDIAIGVVLTLLCVTLILRGGAFAVATLGSVAQVAVQQVPTQTERKWNSLLDTALTTATDATQKQVLQYLRSRGASAVQDFAAESGLTPTELLAKITKTGGEDRKKW